MRLHLQDIKDAEAATQISALERQIAELKAQAAPLHAQIVANLTRKIDVRAEQQRAAANGSLLSWKESLHASLVDSKRVVISPEVRDSNCLLYCDVIVVY